MSITVKPEDQLHRWRAALENQQLDQGCQDIILHLATSLRNQTRPSSSPIRPNVINQLHPAPSPIQPGAVTTSERESPPSHCPTW